MRQLLYLLLILFAWSCTSESNRPPERPNVLFIAVDDLRPELGCYGREWIHSPHIDRLAAEGTRFDRSYCNIPVCGASRASLMTGLRPARNRFLTYLTRADEEAPGITTLPGHFRKHGYYTISNGKIFHHDDDAMDSWDEIWHPGSNSRSWRDYALPENIERDTSDRFRGPPFERAEVSDTVYKDGKTAEKTIRDLRKLKKQEKPFFLATGFLKPHLPFNAPEKYWKMYDGKVSLPENNHPPANAPAESLHNFGELRAYAGVPPEGPVPDEFARELIHGYYACVSYTDALIGKILEELKQLELDRSTIVILWGDHGWNLREHGLWCKHCNYETSLHTPLIVRVPGTKQVGVSSEIVEYVDIYPTLCELAGLELPGHLQGSSFRELLYDPRANSDGVAVCQWYVGITTIREHWFYTEWVNDSDSSYARMLYDHRVDPEENFNISEAPENAETIKALSQEMRRSRAPEYFK
ncbi:MAG: sulfatase [Bacteroidales bacterium]|nr:sulfatase [Bacteroidales bacterium]